MAVLRESKGEYFLSVPVVLVRAKGWDKGKEFTPTINNSNRLEYVEKKKK